MNATNRVPEDGAPNTGQGVDDATEPAEEYELDQVNNERDETRGESMSEQPDPGRDES